VLDDIVAVLMTVAPDPLGPPLAAALPGADAAGELAAAAAPVLLLPLEQAATSTAAPTAAPTPVASFAGPDIRRNIEFLIVFFSLSSAAGRTSSRSPTWLST
jgi:hypothetical protein